MIQRVPASGSCARCQRSLGLTSVKVDGVWYGSAECVGEGECPLDGRKPSVAEAFSFSPRRHFRRRAAKELNRD